MEETYHNVAVGARARAGGVLYVLKRILFSPRPITTSNQAKPSEIMDLRNLDITGHGVLWG